MVFFGWKIVFEHGLLLEITMCTPFQRHQCNVTLLCTHLRCGMASLCIRLLIRILHSPILKILLACKFFLPSVSATSFACPQFSMDLSGITIHKSIHQFLRHPSHWVIPIVYEILPLLGLFARDLLLCICEI